MIAVTGRLNQFFRVNLFNLKRIAKFLILLLVVNFLITSLRQSFTDSIVLTIKLAKSDIIQVFFPLSSKYKEGNSEKTTITDNDFNTVTMSLPLTSTDHIRIDPATQENEIVISRIEVNHLLGNETYNPEEILASSKPLHMIDKFGVTSSGLLLHSTGEDPAFEFQLKRKSIFLANILQGILSVILSLVAWVVLGKISLKMRRVHFFFPVFISAGLAILFYPGSMSYDTFYALRGARNGVTESLWPPMVSYVWRCVDLISHNPTAMHFFQVSLLFCSIYFILFVLVKRLTFINMFFMIYLIIPSVLGTLAVIWKDVLMASFLLAGFAMIEALRLVVNKWSLTMISLLSLFLLFIGICSRHNAITAAVPFLFYFSFTVCSRTIKKNSYFFLYTLVFGVVLTGLLYAAKIQLDTFSLPGFKRLSNSTESQLQTVKVLDVAGASLCVGVNLFAREAQGLSLDEIGRIYDPRHANYSLGLLSRKDVFVNIEDIWRNTAFRHPLCFLYNKFQLTRYMIGANSGQQFLITHPSIDSNEYGYSLPRSAIRNSVFSYILKSSRFFFLKPWFLYLISIGFFVYVLINRNLSISAFSLFLSAFFYIGGFILYGNAADARLLFYTTTVLAMFVLISIANRNKPAG